MHTVWRAFFFPLFLACNWAQAEANELTTVEQKAATCFVCHGDKGNSGIRNGRTWRPSNRFILSTSSMRTNPETGRIR